MGRERGVGSREEGSAEEGKSEDGERVGGGREQGGGRREEGERRGPRREEGGRAGRDGGGGGRRQRRGSEWGRKEGGREAGGDESVARVASRHTGDSVASRKEGQKTREGGIYFEPRLLRMAPPSLGAASHPIPSHPIPSHRRIAGKRNTHYKKHSGRPNGTSRWRNLSAPSEARSRGPRARPRTSRRRRGSCRRMPVCGLVPCEWGVGGATGREEGSGERGVPSSVKRASSSSSSSGGKRRVVDKCCLSFRIQTPTSFVMARMRFCGPDWHRAQAGASTGAHPTRTGRIRRWGARRGGGGHGLRGRGEGGGGRGGAETVAGD
ncbi:hypothetical protein B0H14DRAFT_3660976 [Mycena olivaceomarginata]|nr:hypothetical protein B0H14DRAFT_3660976 [Mycena olivaceomarginata]